MNKISVEILDNNKIKKCSSSDLTPAYFYEESFQDNVNPSVLIHGPKGMLAEYSLNNGPKSTRGTFPLKIHSVSPGKYDLRLEVYDAYGGGGNEEDNSEFVINFPLIVDGSSKKGTLSAVKIAAFVALTIAAIAVAFALYKVVEFERVKVILHSLRSPTSLFIKTG